jgi:ABC-2 type transport system permease protein
MLAAAVNTAVPGLVVLGLGVLLFGVVPRLAAPLLYAFVLWSFLVEIVGADLLHAQWLAHTSILDRLGPVPASGLDLGVVGVLLALTAGAAFAGFVAFDRRDLTPA